MEWTQNAKMNLTDEKVLETKEIRPMSTLSAFDIVLLLQQSYYDNEMKMSRFRVSDFTPIFYYFWEL